MKKFSLTHKLLAVALAFVLVAVSLPDYLSFAQQPAQEQSETESWLTAIRLTLGNRKWNSRVVLHLQAPETVPMGTAGSFGLSAQNTAAVAADVSIQLTQKEMVAYRAAEQDSTLALQLVGDSLTFTLQPGEQVEGTLSFLYPNGYSSPGRWWSCRGGHLDCPAAAPRRRNWRHPDRNHPSRRRNSAAGAGTDAASG